ncbi:ArdC-like ssDNA-binding domain-containing protein [[Clostridium] innocuum]|nr:ArdC-like ssDNA-binding domain-containing protein [[Clostridium] innocuum]
MKNFENLINNQVQKDKQRKATSFNKEEFAQKMQERRDHLFTLAAEQTEKTITSPSVYMDYLNMQSHFHQYTPTNVLLILAQSPHATEIRSFAKWQENKCSIRKGEKGFDILEPGKEYQRDDGSTAIGYDPRCMFDVSQLKNPPTPVPQKQYSTEELVSAMVYKLPLEVKFIEHNDILPAVSYSDTDKSLIIQKEISEHELLEGLATELCFAQLAENYSYDRMELNFPAKSAAYMLCKKYNIEVSDTSFTNDVKDFFDGYEPNDVKGYLAEIKRTFKDVDERMEHGLYAQQQEKLNSRNEHNHESR